MATAGSQLETPSAAAAAQTSDAKRAADAAATEWETATGANQDETVPSQGTLSQGDVNRLIGGHGDQSGLQALLSASGVAQERLPLLEIVCERLARLLTTSLSNFVSQSIEVNLESVSPVRLGDYMNAIPLPAILAVFRAEELENYGLITVDSNLIYSMVDVLLGGAKGTAALRIEGRPYTTIERNLIQDMIQRILADLRKAFEPVSAINFTFDRIETDPRFATVSRPANAAVLTTLRIAIGERGGRIELVLPYATLEPIRGTLLQMFMGEKFGRDAVWETHLASELWRTNVEIEAILDELAMPLKDVINLEVGQTLLLNVGPQSPVEIWCGGVRLLAGRMGRVGSNIAVSIDSQMKKPA